MKNKIAFFRKQMKLTQKELAEIVGVNRQVIVSLEKERYNPSMELSLKITKALNQKNMLDIFLLK